jgi:lipopolysaccharide transport system ATP-binding protein
MYVRLAFAVAAHLNPEILIVDEVLAVGDSEFQKKCLGKMRDVATSGRTVLLVSHNMQSISVLCNKAMVLQRGVLVHEGDVDTAVERYLDLSLVEDEDAPALAMRRPGSGEYRFTSMKPQKDTYGGGDEKIIEFRIERQKHQLGRMYVSANIANEMGMVIAQLDSRLDDFWLDDADTIEGLLKIRTPWLKPGTYTIEAYICAGGIVDKYERACTFQVSPLLPYTKGTVSDDGVALGVVFSEFSWHQVQGTTVMTASR